MSQYWIWLFSVSLHFWIISAQTNSQDASALNSLRNLWQNTPTNWKGADPCGNNGNKWDGIDCRDSRVISITLSTAGIIGSLSGDIGHLTELQALDLSYNKNLIGPLPATIGNLQKLMNLILVGCSFTGSIPKEIGNLRQLVFLSLNSNGFTGEIPATIGNLSKLYWLDLADNKLTGTIPVSDGSTPGLDMLTSTSHFHFGKNQLSGTIPPQLFSSDMVLIHLLLDSNKLSGEIPSTLGLVKSLEVLRLDRNSFVGSVPSNLNNLTRISELHLSNNKFTGPVPNLTGMSSLTYADLSNNSYDASGIPGWFSTIQSLTTLFMDNLQIQGTLPTTLFSFPQLQTLSMRNNEINGTFDMGNNYSGQLQLVDLENNHITEVVIGHGYSNELILVGNPVCQESGVSSSFCTLPAPPTPYSTGTPNCVVAACPLADQRLSPNCSCSYPYNGTLYFRAPSFSDLGNATKFMALEKQLITAFQTYNIPVDSVSLHNPSKDSDDYLEIGLNIFPSGEERFNLSEVSRIGFMLSNQTFKPPKFFGPFYFIANPYPFTEASGSNNSVSKAVIIGAAGGGVVVALLLLCAGIYAFRHRKRPEKTIEQNKPFASWDPAAISSGSVSVPQLKGARWFTFDELKKSTNNFSETNDIGSGGYGKVYRGTLSNGQLLAIKRAQQGSMQGGLEFKTEIELLSRLHHKNLVSLLGFCFEQGEQMLIYEYVPNGTLKESLSGKSGVRLDWKRRLRVALGSAKGLHYLHELANPTIIHRDIKSNNILLDERLNAKVADFGLSKPVGDREKDHVTTQVKGTMGYLDPEYYMSQQLTEKSDVYSFGVLMLEIITAKKPIERGRYIVREVKMAMDRTKDLYGLHELLDPTLGLGNMLGGFTKFVDLAMKCVQESGSDRPSMGEVLKEIEIILQEAGINANVDSASTSATDYEGMSRGHSLHPYNNDTFFDYSGGYPPSSKVEPK